MVDQMVCFARDVRLYKAVLMINWSKKFLHQGDYSSSKSLANGGISVRLAFGHWAHGFQDKGPTLEFSNISLL